MEYRNLGRSGLKVSPLCLGTMMFGGRTDEATALRIVAAARDVGINFIDTADVYNGGASEEITGRAVAAERDHWVLATKVCNVMGPGPNQGGLSRKWIMEAAADSLRRLGTDVIDIYYLHKEDLATPLEETVAAIGDLMRQGKIRYFGVSNYRSWRIAEIVRICDALAVPRPVVNQPYYNALKRQPEIEQLPVCGHYGLGVVPYSPLARGLLTGKYDPAAPAPAETRAGVEDVRMMETEWRPESLETARKIKAYAEARGVAPAHLALNWVLNNELICGVVAGPRTEAQWHDYVAALDYAYSAEDEALIESLVPKGQASPPGFSDPLYPIEGRVPRIG